MDDTNLLPCPFCDTKEVQKAPLRLVHIEWVDAHGCSSEWTRLEVTTPHPVICQSVGWLLHDGDDCKVIVPHIVEESASVDAQGCGDMTIPSLSVGSIVDLVIVLNNGGDDDAMKVTDYLSSHCSHTYAADRMLIHCVLCSVEVATDLLEARTENETLRKELDALREEIDGMRAEEIACQNEDHAPVIVPHIRPADLFHTRQGAINEERCGVCGRGRKP